MEGSETARNGEGKLETYKDIATLARALNRLRDRGLGLLWGVGKAAVNLPALVLLSHIPAGCDPEAGGGVAICGKGIVYVPCRVLPCRAG